MIQPSFETVEAAGSGVPLLRYRREASRQVLVLSSLFHEEPRLRRLCGQIMRGLAAAGIGSALPDLGGLGENVDPLPARFDGWRHGAAAAATAIGATHSLALRAGALFDDAVPADRRWRFVPATGGAIARDLLRAAAIEQREGGGSPSADALAEAARRDGARLAGHALSSELFRTLEAAVPLPACGRTVRLAHDARSAHCRVAGPMLWRQSDPGGDAALAQAIVGDVVVWVA